MDTVASLQEKYPKRGHKPWQNCHCAYAARTEAKQSRRPGKIASSPQSTGQIKSWVFCQFATVSQDHFFWRRDRSGCRKSGRYKYLRLTVAGCSV